MATAQLRPGAPGKGSGGKVRPGRTPPAEPGEAFPPLSISLDGFIKDGSDREFRRLIYSLLSLSALMERNREHFAAYIGVTSPQSMMMAIIAESPNVTVSGVAERLSVSTQFVTMEINKLIARDIVEKRPNEADRRSMFLSLTAKGRALIRELGPLRRQVNDMTFRSLTGERAGTLQEILDGLVMDAQTAVHEQEAPHMRGKMAPSAEADSALVQSSRRAAKSVATSGTPRRARA